MAGKVQTQVLDYLESAGEVTTEQIAVAMKIERGRTTQILIGLERSRLIVRVRETGKRNAKIITWRIATENDLFKPIVGEAEFPPNWPRADPIVWGAVEAMCEVRS
jgi:Mn-dependent DtxR family transcriptional regulator